MGGSLRRRSCDVCLLRWMEGVYFRNMMGSCDGVVFKPVGVVDLQVSGLNMYERV